MTTTQAVVHLLSSRQWAALAGPTVLIAIMLWAFRKGHGRFGFPLGYLLAFGLYWIGWCLIFPAFLLGGWRALVDLFQPVAAFGALSWVTHLLLWWPIVFPLLFMFLPRLRKANWAILLASLALGIVIGVTEEILWRGVYLRLFPGNIWLGLLYPSLLFGLWHICPLSVLANKLPGGAASFVIYAVLLGLTYGLAAQRTGSIYWPTVAHVIHDTLGLGGFTYAACARRSRRLPLENLGPPPLVQRCAEHLAPGGGRGADHSRHRG